MKLTMSAYCDIFIMGAGIAGLMAASTIKNSKVIIASSTHIASGSSFYPGTWGLGLIGPENVEDEKDLQETIETIGCGMCNPKLVNTLVTSIPKRIQQLKDMSIQLKQSEDGNQKEFIPCFDHKRRNWNGILFQSAKQGFQHILDKQLVEQLANHEVVDIVVDEGKVAGVVVLNDKNQLSYIGCKSIIIASGGFGGIYKYRLNTNDIQGMGQYLALKSGAKLVNMEFMQMMTGFLKPARNTIYNEKMYQYTTFCSKGTQMFVGNRDPELLKQRSTYGPFTSRLSSRKIDIELYKRFIQDESSITIKHNSMVRNTNIEFIQTYFDWLKTDKKIAIEDEIQIGMFYHAANGGIQIDENASTGIAGMYACGEVTGGMHGADRLGGLSSANALVFGHIAGAQAEQYVQTHDIPYKKDIDYKEIQYEHAKEKLVQLQSIMFQHAMVVRDEKGLLNANKQIEDIERSLLSYSSSDEHNRADSYHLKVAIVLSKAIIKACLLRKESRGSHYREDYPKQDKAYNKVMIVEGYEKLKLYFKEAE